MSKIIVRAVIQDVHMGLGHSGLSDVIRAHKKKNKLFAEVMKTDGGMVLFLNASRTAAKLFYENGEVIGYLRMQSKLTAENIDLIPRTFGGSLEYSSAVKNAFKALLQIENEKKSKVADKTLLHA
jgi:hypothetical protein